LHIRTELTSAANGQIRGMDDEAVCKKCQRKKKLTLVAFGA